ncbi:DEKNAAC100836 [Brettanomyces naardenensis]|uniref:DEKNAAC100836 n=1 Tax=Brettanomyces naardenensis TaxID=13370 RepID=A0A448YEN4_BRENA|nr:DEKNAAC100836 [Brettanomyces naardenensis]
MWEDYFSVQIFFIILRETLESAIIISVLLSLVKQTFTAFDPVSGKDVLTVDKSTYSRYRSQVWIGALLGLLLCTGIGGVFIGIFYFIGNDIWSIAERVWEGFFSIISALIIAVMGLALLRVNSLQSKWRWKLGKSLQCNISRSPSTPVSSEDTVTTMTESWSSEDDHVLEELQDEPMYSDISEFVSFRKRMRQFGQKYSLVILPFITTLREGLEAVVFVGGIGVNQPATSFPLAIIIGALVGASVGIVMYEGGNKMSLQFFLIGSACFLYLVAAGLMSKGVWFFELESFVQKCGQDTSETGSGPGSYDISTAVWHVNCCNGLTDGGWMLFNALFGWTNTATYGSVLSYILFWVFIVGLLRHRASVEKYGYTSAFPIRWQLKMVKRRIIADRVLLQECLDDVNCVRTGGLGINSGRRKPNEDHLVPSTAATDESSTLLVEHQ